jgi:hypothetical protein
MVVMGFPGTWMTESQSMVYRVVPKCACSTIGQIMYFSDHGRFYDGDIHAQLRRANSSHIPARATADYDEIEIHFLTIDY